MFVHDHPIAILLLPYCGPADRHIALVAVRMDDRGLKRFRTPRLSADGMNREITAVLKADGAK